MKVTVEMRNDAVVVMLGGEIDHHSSEEIRTKVDSFLRKNGAKELILNFADVSFMDSSGLGVILGRYKQVKAMGGVLRVEDVPKRIERILRMSGVYTLIENGRGKQGRQAGNE